MEEKEVEKQPETWTEVHGPMPPYWWMFLKALFCRKKEKKQQ